ncbi:uncharacterized protein RSE6_07196 [Rhynchosporium secalis]|uniref:Uncharacterized protein n=1 Tax=Rhynchosporium secalis TaxID=38038 RepID=A0A1E1MCA2_RHYSE|nr:uncharacterized protein RSE6_07196 [Rhynchosporium secalis]
MTDLLIICPSSFISSILPDVSATPGLPLKKKRKYREMKEEEHSIKRRRAVPSLLVAV